MKDFINATKLMRNIELKENQMLIKKFKELFLSNQKSIRDILIKENSVSKANYQYDELLKIVEKIDNYPYDNLKKFLSIGTVACITNGDVYFVLELILKAFLTKTKIAFVTQGYMISINTYLVELAKAVLEEYNILSEAVSIFTTFNYKDVIKAVDNIDCILINKNYQMYKDIMELTNIKVFYSDYGNVNVYNDSKDFEDEIKKLCNDAKKTDKDIFLTKTDDIKSYLDNMPNNFVFDSVVIYSKDLDKCTYFFKNIKAENVYINKNPFDYVNVNFPEFEFLYKKNITY